MITVTKEQFYSTVGRLDVTLRAHRELTEWRLKSSMEIIGETNGYLNSGNPEVYKICDKLAKNLS